MCGLFRHRLTRVRTHVPVQRMNDIETSDGESLEIDSSYLGLILMKLTHRFFRMHEEMANRSGVLGLRASFGGVLTNLATRPHRLSELAEINRTRPQSMVKIINELESLSYVERVDDPSDSRAKLVRLTNTGRDMLNIARDTSNDIYDLYAGIVGEERLRNMLNTMTGLIHGLDEELG